MAEAEIKDITKPISLSITKEKNGLYFAELEIEKNSYIAPQCYVEFLRELYIVKKINKIIDRGKISFKVKLHHAMVELNDKSIIPFTYTGQTPTQMFTAILAGTRWAIGTIDITATSTVKNDKRITCLAALMLVAKQFGGEIYFNCAKQTDGTFTRTVDLKATIGDQTTKPMVRYDKNAEHIERIENVEKLCTRLYIYGKDNLTIAGVNGGLDYLDSTHIDDYPEPIETTIYTQIDDATRLLNYGQIYLGLYEHPLYSYILDVFDKSIFPLWTLETFDIGDNIRVYNLDLGLNVDCRIQRIVKNVTAGTMVIELENLVDKITDFLALLDYYVDHPNDGYYDNNPFVPPELPPSNPPGGEGPPISIPMSGMYLIKANTLADGDSLRHIARKKIVVDSLGQFWCVYARSDGTHNQVYCARSTNGQAWTEEVLTVSDMGGDVLYDYLNFGSPVIAIDSNDVVYVVFVGITTGSGILFVKYDGSWSAQTLMDFYAGSVYMTYPSIAIDSGDVVHVLAQNYNAGGSLHHKSSANGGSSWSDDHNVGVGSITEDDATAFEIDGNNVLHIGNAEIDYPGLGRVKYYRSSNGGVTWSAEVILNHYPGTAVPPTGAYASTISLAIDSLNNIHAIWVEDATVSKIYYSKNTGGVWSHPIVLSNPAYDSYGGTISVDESDKIYVLWVGKISAVIGAVRQLKVRTLAGGYWTPETTQTASGLQKRYPTLIQAQFPVANGIRYNISRNGFIVIFTIGNDIWIWFHCDWHI